MAPPQSALNNQLQGQPSHVVNVAAVVSTNPCRWFYSQRTHWRKSQCSPCVPPETWWWATWILKPCDAPPPPMKGFLVVVPWSLCDALQRFTDGPLGVCDDPPMKAFLVIAIWCLSDARPRYIILVSIQLSMIFYWASETMLMCSM